MQILTIDAETYFDNDYTLKKMTTEAYIRDPRFEPLLWAYRLPTGEFGWVGQEHAHAFFASFDWSKTAVLMHHAHFDGLILSHHYGIRPAFFFDTLAMGRAVLGNHLRVGLDALAKHFNLEQKRVPYDLFRGRRWANLFPHERAAIAGGAVHDVRLTGQIFNELKTNFPAREFSVIDRTTRMFTEPLLQADVPALHQIVHEEQAQAAELLRELNVTEDDLQSSARFVELLTGEGVEVEYKPGKNAPLPALAKTDDFMKELLEHENSRVVALAQARLNAKSTINETRAGRLAAMGSRGPLSVYLKYCGAHTTRFSGGDALNFQNFPGSHRSRIRSAVHVPKGTILCTVDSAQGEARILNYVAGQTDIVDAFRAKRDVYAEAASRFYNRPITKRDNPAERQLGKVIELSCGYGIGAPRFRATCKAGALGGPPIHLSELEAESAVTSYRDSHPMVTAYWRMASRMIARIAGGEPLPWGPLVVETGRIRCPSGLYLQYPDLKHNEGEIEGWSYRNRNGRTRLYGGKLVENVVQMMHRCAVVEAIMEVLDEAPHFRLVLSSHDDASFLLPDDQYVQQNVAWIEEKFRKAPAWLPGIPFDAESVVGYTYDK